VNNIFDLEGKTVLGLRDGIHLAALENLTRRYGVSCRIISMDSYDAAMRGIESGKGDVAVVNRTFSTRIGGNYKSVASLFSFNPIPLHFATTKQRNYDLVHALDDALSDQGNDPDSALQEAMNRWLKPEPRSAIPLWIHFVTVGLLTGLLMFAGIAFLLRLMVRQRTRELENERMKTIEAMRSQSLFFTTMSHEIRTPLNHVIGIVDLLLHEYADNPELVDRLRIIESGGNRMGNLLNSLFYFADLDRGDLTLKEEVVSLYQVFNDIRRTAAAFPRKNGVDFEHRFEIDPEMMVRADPRALSRIILNLVHNATKFTDSGRIDLHVRAEADAADRIRIIVEVSDTGCGIPHDELEEIRKPFRRGTRIDFVENGSGLGLPIVEKILRLLNGRMEVQTEVGKGSTFRVELVARAEGAA
jgi:signal transduction histidine kinase